MGGIQHSLQEGTATLLLLCVTATLAFTMKHAMGISITIPVIVPTNGPKLIVNYRQIYVYIMYIYIWTLYIFYWIKVFLKLPFAISFSVLYIYIYIYHPGNYNCDSSNIVYLLMCNKCNYGNYVGETSTKFRLRMNNHKKSIQDNHKGLPVAVHYNQADHSINDLSCVILSGNFTTTADRQLYEQKLIQRFDTYKCGLNRDLGFLSKYAFFNRS